MGKNKVCGVVPVVQLVARMLNHRDYQAQAMAVGVAWLWLIVIVHEAWCLTPSQV